MDIEQQFTAEERLKQGIFFTAENIVNKITASIPWCGNEKIIDSAAGDGVFLINLAKQYPDMEFFAIEKNEAICQAGKQRTAKYPQIKWFHGDGILDDFPIPECDAYLGNPPFLNFSDLLPEYAEKLKPLWKKYFPLPTGFSQLLGASRGDIGQLFFTHTIQRYLKTDGFFGVVLPNSLLFGNEASAGFREFRGISVSHCADITDSNPFRYTQRDCFYIIGQKGGRTALPIEYRENGKSRKLYKTGNQLTIDERKLRKSSYKARQGINTLGANSVFIFKNKPPFQSSLIHPLLKSTDIQAFSHQKSYSMLIPYSKSGTLLKEEELMEDREAWNWLSAHKSVLQNRKSRFAQKNWYGLFGIGPYTFSPFKVVWKALGARKLEAAVVEEGIPNQAMHAYFSVSTKEEAHYLCALMNSREMNYRVANLSRPGAKSFALPSVLTNCGIPAFNNRNEDHLLLSRYSLQFHKNMVNADKEKWEKTAKKILCQQK